MEKFIVHVDMDAFFAAIEQRDNSSIRGKPVVVGADPKGGRGRGVVSTCSYEARKFGLHSAMPISIAYKKCPQAVFLPVDMERYQEASLQVYEILYQFTPKIEPVGIDEAFLDISGSWHLFKSPLNTCALIKEKIKKELNLTASIGLGPNKMVAKIASDLEKPDGLVSVTKESLLSFLWPLDIGKIWGLGNKSKDAFYDIGIRTIGDLAKTKIEVITDIFGKNGEYFWYLANGIDESEVETEEEIKSISNEDTFERDTSDSDKIKGTLVYLCEKVSRRLRKQGFKSKTITLKIRLSGFNTYTRSKTLTKATNFVDDIYKVTNIALSEFKSKNKKIRLIGVKVSNLILAGEQDSLFVGDQEKKRERAHQAVDKIRDKFGTQAIRRAGSSFG